MMDCKNALAEANGDVEKAIDILRKKGLATLAKRAERETTEGLVVGKTSKDGKVAAMATLCCETDFVSRSADFVAAYQAMGPHVEPPGPLALPAYEAAQQVLEALERDIAANGALAREGVAAALAGVEQGDETLYWYRVGDDGVPEYVP